MAEILEHIRTRTILSNPVCEQAPGHGKPLNNERTIRPDGKPVCWGFRVLLWCRHPSIIDSIIAPCLLSLSLLYLACVFLKRPLPHARSCARAIESVFLSTVISLSSTRESFISPILSLHPFHARGFYELSFHLLSLLIAECIPSVPLYGSSEKCSKTSSWRRSDSIFLRILLIIIDGSLYDLYTIYLVKFMKVYNKK